MFFNSATALLILNFLASSKLVTSSSGSGSNIRRGSAVIPSSSQNNVYSHRQLVSSHNNHFYIEQISANIQHITVKITDHSISSGQPWHSPTYKYDPSGHGKLAILIPAGRHGSSGVADWFKSGLSFDNMRGTDGTTATSPHDLNFAVKMDFTVIYTDGTSKTLSDFRLGQGHDSNSHNNWWLGHSSCQKHDGDLDDPTEELVCDNLYFDFKDVSNVYTILLPSA